MLRCLVRSANDRRAEDGRNKSGRTCTVTGPLVRGQPLASLTATKYSPSPAPERTSRSLRGWGRWRRTKRRSRSRGSAGCRSCRDEAHDLIEGGGEGIARFGMHRDGGRGVLFTAWLSTAVADGVGGGYGGEGVLEGPFKSGPVQETPDEVDGIGGRGGVHVGNAHAHGRSS